MPEYIMQIEMGNAPITIQELVRCQDCEHYHENIWGGEIGLGKPYDNIIVGHHGCDIWGKGDGKDMAYTSPNGFCFLGERKE